MTPATTAASAVRRSFGWRSTERGRRPTGSLLIGGWWSFLRHCSGTKHPPIVETTAHFSARRGRRAGREGSTATAQARGSGQTVTGHQPPGRAILASKGDDMPYYRVAGEIPGKRHVRFRRPDGGLYSEELMGEEGFVSDSSLLYHVHPPTAIV